MTSREQFDLSARRPYSVDDFDGYQAAPLLISGPEAKEELIENQDRLLKLLGDVAMWEIPHYTSQNSEEDGKDIASYVADRIQSRMYQREGMNASVYNFSRLYKTPDVTFGLPDIDPRTIQEAAEAARHGRGTVLQNDLARRAFGMASIEYANLTVVGEFRRELEIPMWEEVSELIDADATPKFEQMTNLRVLGFHQRDHRSIDPGSFGALRIGMKRKLGTLDDGTEVKARTAAIINTRTSYGLQRDDLQEILSTAIRVDAKGKYEHVQNADMSQNPAFMRVLRWLIDEEMKPGTVLARNETVYGVNPRTVELIEERRAQKQAEADRKLATN